MITQRIKTILDTPKGFKLATTIRKRHIELYWIIFLEYTTQPPWIDKVTM